MMAMKQQLVVSISGDLGGDLDKFRDLLQLSKHGRLSDDWDQEFGSHILRPRDDGLIRLDLSRYTDDKWGITLTYERDPLAEDELADLRNQIVAAAAAVGVIVTKQSS